MSQSTRSIVMVRPSVFYSDADTAADNKFQRSAQAVGEVRQQQTEAAQQEFDGVVRILSAEGVNVTVFTANADRDMPNAVFPNNWFSSHAPCPAKDDEEEPMPTCVLYPMKCANRRLERDPAIIQWLCETHSVVDLSASERDDQVLEGTGALVIDRTRRLAFACRSPRMHESVLAKWADATQHTAVPFTALDPDGNSVYHTNVILAVASTFFIVYADGIQEAERDAVLSALRDNGRVQQITISWDQVLKFCGNVLEVKAGKAAAQPLLVMSDTARAAFTEDQLRCIAATHRIVSVPIPTIETLGGGGVRCMMAEVFH